MKVLITTGLLALAVSVSAVADDKKPDDKAKLEGGYTIVSGEKAGKAIPENEIKGSIVRFTGDKILGTDKDKKEFFSADYTLDTSKTPWVITMTSKQPKEAKTTGLIKKDGDTVTVIYALPGGDAPKDFKTKDNQQLFVLKNMNTKPK